MRTGSVVAALACALALGACGGGSGGGDSSVNVGSVTQPAITTPKAGQAQNRPSAQAKATGTATTATPPRATITAGGQQSTVAPGTRAACIRRWAPQFPAGQARRAILSQCRNLPR